MRAAAGTACSQTRLKSETCTTTEPGRGRGPRERNTSLRRRERMSMEEKEGKICRLRAKQTWRIVWRKRGTWTQIQT